MRLLDRYLLRELLTWLFFCLAGFVLFCVSFDLIASLNKIQEHQLLPRDVAEMYLVKLPGMMVFILPIALLVSLLIALTTHTRHNELTAMRAAGVGLWRLCVPYMAVGFLLSVGVFAMNELLVPNTDAKLAQIMDRRLRQNASHPDGAIQANSGFPNLRDGRNWVWDKFNTKTGALTNPKVDWTENGATYSLFARYAERVNDVWTFYGNCYFTPNDLINVDSLTKRLEKPTDPLAQFVASKLSTNTLALMARPGAGTNAELKRLLADDLNRAVRSATLYEPERFTNATLSTNLAEAAALQHTGLDLLMFNRLLLCQAWTNELSRHSANSVMISKEGTVLRSTNVLAMPQFTETPNDFEIEAKFNQRFQTPGADFAGAPIVEIAAYRRLHPDLTPNNKHILDTQLNGRIASPWSCLIVVFIAVPFGAASGRRNLFAGVAGSIAVCFIYFILLKVGLSLGTRGFVPGWFAAWLPNAVFGITGFWMMLRVR